MFSEEKDTFIMTDTNSGITYEEAKKLGIGLVPMPFIIDGKEYYEGENIDREQFFTFMKENKTILTSQPPVGKLMDMFDEALKHHDEIVYIPMSSALSGSFITAQSLAMSHSGEIYVVDNKRISCTQKQSVLEALSMSKKGFSGKNIKTLLENHKDDASIYIMPESLYYLKRGGRITASALSIATVLNIRPILQINGDKLDSFAKARGIKNAENIMLEAVKYDMENRFSRKEVTIKGAYLGNIETALSWKENIESFFPNYNISLDELSLSIASHTGPKALAIVCMAKLPEAKDVNYEI